MPKDQGSSIAKIVAGDEDRILADWLQALGADATLRAGRITDLVPERSSLSLPREFTP